MLNRIYIIVGLLAIVVLAAAFIAPRFIQWSDYRERMEELASGVLGADVTIRGDIEFNLLPRPRLHFSDIIVGNPAAPAATVKQVDAEFALMDFLRDNYNVTSLVLHGPQIDLAIDENGLFGAGVDVSAAGAGVALAHARVDEGVIRLRDGRTGEVFSASAIAGELRLSSFAGPFQFQGAAVYSGRRYEVRFNSGTTDGEGNTRISSYLRPADGAFSWAAEGMLATGAAPRFDGTMTYRQAPPPAQRADEIRGDLVFASGIAASTDRVVLSGYTLQLDENRAGMRLTGSAGIQLGSRRDFDAVVSGGVFSLPPRDANEAPAELPYEFVRMLSELPVPPQAPMPGRVEIDLAEMGLRGFSLRNFRMVASTDGAGWQIEQARATMPGETELRLKGKLDNDDDALGFRGELSVSSARLDALAQLWRRPREDNPLFNLPGNLTGQVLLAGDALGLQNGRFTLGGVTHNLELRLGYGDEARLDVVTQFGDLSPGNSDALMALLPDIAAGDNFRVSFPEGSFSVAAETVDILGLPAADFLAEGQWLPNSVRLSRFASTDWGGLGLNATLRIGGSLADPVFTGSGSFSYASGDAPGLGVINELAGVPFLWQQALETAGPANLQFALGPDESDEGQVLTLNGELGGGRLDLRAGLVGGLTRLASADLRLVASLEAETAGQLAGFGDLLPFGGEGATLASLFFEGAAADGFEGRVSVSQGEDSASYFGRIALAGHGALSGEGTLDMRLGDGSGLLALAGAGAGSLGAIEASAALDFEGAQRFALTNIAGVAGDAGLSGAISMQRLGQLPTFSGKLMLDALDGEAVLAAMFGAPAFIGGAGQTWPEGPIAANAEPRPSRGDISIQARALHLAGRERANEAGFIFSWSPDSIGISRLTATIGGGSLGLDLTQCCAGPLLERSLSGRLSLDGVDLVTVAPEGVSGTLSGRLQGGVQFEGTGESFAAIMRTMTGEGNFAVSGLSIAALSPGVYPAAAGLEDVLNTDADALEALIDLALGQGAFTASEARGAFAIAGGTLRLGNLIIEGAGARLAGTLNLVLQNLGLDGSFVMTPLGFADPGDLVEPDTARIIARIAGTLLAPRVTLDPSDMVAALQVRANEMEVDRLEALRAEDEARQRAAAEERNRLIEAQRRKAAEELAARQAAEAEARRREEERLLEENRVQQPDAPPPAPLPSGPLNLDYQPPRNVPIGPQVNRPLELLPN